MSKAASYGGFFTNTCTCTNTRRHTIVFLSKLLVIFFLGFLGSSLISDPLYTQDPELIFGLTEGFSGRYCTTAKIKLSLIKELNSLKKKRGKL